MKSVCKKGVYFLFALSVLAFLCPSAGRAMGGDERTARVLLDRMRASRARLENFACTIECVSALPAGQRTRSVRRVLYDNAGRGRIEMADSLGRRIYTWDGRQSMECQEQRCLGYAPRSVIIRPGQHSETALRNRPPWTFLGYKFCDFLARILKESDIVSVKQLERNIYRIEGVYGFGGRGVAIVDARHGYSITNQEYYIDRELQQRFKTEFAQVRPGIWFPVRGQHKADTVTTVRFRDVVVNDPNVGDNSFTVDLSVGTQVSDYVAGKEYVVGMTGVYDLEQSGQSPYGGSELGPGSNSEDSSWREAFLEVYRLDEGQVLKHIAPPFIQQRSSYIRRDGRVASLHDEFAVYVFAWDDGLSEPCFHATNCFVPLRVILQSVLGLASFQYEGPDEVLDLRLAGDWVIRQDTPSAVLLESLQKIIEQETNLKIQFIKRQVESPVVVASGAFQFTALSEEDAQNTVHVFAGQLDRSNGCGGGTGTLERFLRYVEKNIAIPILDHTEKTGAPVELCWRLYNSSGLCEAKHLTVENNKNLTSLLQNLSMQTGLEFEVEPRMTDKWLIALE